MRVVPAIRFHRHREIALLDGHLSWHHGMVMVRKGWLGRRENRNTMENPWKFIVYHGLSSCLINHVLPHVMAKKTMGSNDIQTNPRRKHGLFTWKKLWSVKNNSSILGLWNPEPDHKTSPKWIGSELLVMDIAISLRVHLLKNHRGFMVFLPFFPAVSLTTPWSSDDSLMTRLQVLINTREYPCHIHIPIDTING